MIKLLPRYLYRQTALGIALAALVITALIFVVNLVELSRSLDAQPGIATSQILYLTVLRMPAMIAQTLPFMVLFGVMWALFRLNRRSELVAMRAASMSAWQFALPALLIAFALGVLGTTVLNPAAARLETRFEKEQARLLDAAKPDKEPTQNTMWFREASSAGIVVIRAGHVIPRTAQLYDLTFYYYTRKPDGTPVILHRLDAEKAVLKPGFWQVYNARDLFLAQPPKTYDTLALPTTIAPSALLQNARGPDNISIYALPETIKNARKAGFDTRPYRIQLHKLLALPLTMAAMALIGAAFSFNFVRLGGALRLALIAGSAGFALYFSTDLLETLGANKVLPPVLAVWAAPVFVFFAGLARITILEDG